MKKMRGWIVFLLLVLVSGCLQPPEVSSPQPPGPPAASPTPAVRPDDLPDVNAAARAYLDAWKDDDYPRMYALLTSVSQDALSEAEFIRHYQGVAAEAALQRLDYTLLSSFTNPDTAQVSYRVTLHSLLVNDVTGDTVMNLSLEKGEWRVQWDDTLVLPWLSGANYLRMERQGYTPSRGNIYDRNGHALVAQADATAIGLYPDQIDPNQIGQLFAELYELTGLSAETIQAMYANFPAGAGWYLPLKEVAAYRVAERYQTLSGLSGLVLKPYKARYYFDGGVAPHLVGFVAQIPAEELESYLRLGYEQDERVGRAGLEAWGEQYLAGKRGGALYVYNNQGPVTRLAEANPGPAQAIYTTIDRDFQLAAQQAIAGFRGAIVVLERDTGRVLALVSSPGFDPNAFEPINFNSATLQEDILANPDNPTLNRATLGVYPLGSVFKVITMAAGLESGRYSPETTYQCGYQFKEIEGLTLYDWTYEHYQTDRKTQPSGLLTLSEGLMRSCNPYFWHIGLDLYNQDQAERVPELARGFGLGQKTGIEGVVEATGQVPDQENQVDALNLAIGQGDLLVTPLQVARFVAAIGNGGTLYRPQVIERIAPPGGEPSYTFQPQALGKLPISAATLASVQEAMVGVLRNTKPRGTAYHVFTGFDVPAAGKTGTATSGSGLPHAWFAGYTFAEQDDRPDIAVAVVIENVGEGSDYAAPIFRRIVTLYFTENQSTGPIYRWESAPGVTKTPAPGGP